MNRILRILSLLGFMVLAVSSQAQTISNRQTACPYDTLVPPCRLTGSISGCNISGYQPRHQQDCCGAIRLCKDTNTVYNAGGTSAPGLINSAICGEGCVTSEINSNTCLSSSENQTSWYTFEVRPLPTGGKRIGDFAGYLRMKIIPCDVPPNPSSCTTNCDCDRVTASHPQVFNDNGTSSTLGSTDYDWILYEITSLPRNSDITQACPQITNAVPITGNRVPGRPWVRSCNYSGDRGPTGLYDPQAFPFAGDSTQGGGGDRYNRPIAVYVGQRFVLAVDNFSTNPKGYKIDFTGRGNRLFLPPPFPDFYPTATVVPPSGLISLDSAINVTTCGRNEIQIRFSRPVPVDSIRASNFRINNPNVPPIQIIDIIPDPTDVVLGFASRYTLLVSALYASPTYTLTQTQAITDPCGNQSRLDNFPFEIKPFTYYDSVPQVCQNRTLPPLNGNTVKSVTLTTSIGRTVVINNPGAYRYIWKRFGGLTATGDSIWIPLPSVNTPGDTFQVTPPSNLADILRRKGPSLTYTPIGGRTDFILPIHLVAFIEGGACIDSARAAIRVNAQPEYAMTPVNICYGDLARLRINPADTVNRRITWVSERLGVLQNGGLEWTRTGDTLSYDRVRIYTVDRRTGCEVFSDPVKVQTAQKYVVNFAIDTLSITGASFPMTVRLRQLVKRIAPDGSLIPIGFQGVKFIWNMGNGDIVESVGNEQPLYTYITGPRANEVGYSDFVPVLTVYDSAAAIADPNRCLAPPVTGTSVRVYQPIAPNIITPGQNDGQNDKLVIHGFSDESAVTVYNRWGYKVFESDRYRGEFDGKEVSNGIYFYQVKDRLTGKIVTGWLEVMR